VGIEMTFWASLSASGLGARDADPILILTGEDVYFGRVEPVADGGLLPESLPLKMLLPWVYLVKL
jgi:hypothetical protein